MEKRTCLENLIFQTGLKLKDFAKRVSVKESTLHKQKYDQKDTNINHAIKYARILGIEEIKGYYDGVYLEIKIKINDIEVN